GRLPALPAALRPIRLHPFADGLPSGGTHAAPPGSAASATSIRERAERRFKGRDISIDACLFSSQFRERLLERTTHVIGHHLSLRRGFGYRLVGGVYLDGILSREGISVKNSFVDTIHVQAIPFP